MSNFESTSEDYQLKHAALINALVRIDRELREDSKEEEAAQLYQRICQYKQEYLDAYYGEQLQGVELSFEQVNGGWNLVITRNGEPAPKGIEDYCIEQFRKTIGELPECIKATGIIKVHPSRSIITNIE